MSFFVLFFLFSSQAANIESRPKRRKGHSLYNNNRLDFLLFFSPLQKKKQKSKRKERVRPHPRLPACSFFVISTTTIPPTTTPQPTTTTLPPTTSLPSLWLNICLRLVLPPSGYPTRQPTNPPVIIVSFLPASSSSSSSCSSSSSPSCSSSSSSSSSYPPQEAHFFSRTYCSLPAFLRSPVTSSFHDQYSLNRPSANLL